ncbi:hypothetical protein ECANGB1_2318 [Enterospora canceri]|uniref:Uncharacterized protein n=1 Tax=Enterospora canceri TaxID=1081671 RepID=A0A1Y1S5H0_9MICR|nr:hypothetical protein ECANGB1_2318 [Enterospora canceri]
MSEKLFREYFKELRRVSEYRKNRKKLLNMIFWEYENYNMDKFEDRDAKIYKIISEKKNYPNSFLGSSLGFTKSTMDSRYQEVLNKFRLDKRPQVASPRNCLEFEKLKFLLVKLFEFKKKKK